MKFYAVGYTNGGANEKRLGPFGSIDEAKRNGIAEMNRNRGAFSFSGVVDDDGKYVFKNSAPRTSNPVVQNALAANATGCLDEYKSRARGAVNAGYNFLREKVALVANDAERLADMSRSRDDKNGWAVIHRKQSLLEDMVEKFWNDAQRVIDS